VPAAQSTFVRVAARAERRTAQRRGNPRSRGIKSCGIRALSRIGMGISFGLRRIDSGRSDRKKPGPGIPPRQTRIGNSSTGIELRASEVLPGSRCLRPPLRGRLRRRQLDHSRPLHAPPTRSGKRSGKRSGNHANKRGESQRRILIETPL